MSIRQTIIGIFCWFASIILSFVFFWPTIILGLMFKSNIPTYVFSSIPVFLFIYGASIIKHGIIFCLLSICLLLLISPTYTESVKSNKIESNSERYNSGAYIYETDIKINWMLLSIYIIIFIYGIYLILFVNLGTPVTPVITIPTITTTTES